MRRQLNCRRTGREVAGVGDEGIIDGVVLWRKKVKNALKRLIRSWEREMKRLIIAINGRVLTAFSKSCSKVMIFTANKTRILLDLD